MTYQMFEFSALSNADLGGSAHSGLSFVMPGSTDTHAALYDNDFGLSDDHRNQSRDPTGQTGEVLVDGLAVGGSEQWYADKVYTVRGPDGREYELITVQQEHTGMEIYTFNADFGVPSAGMTLTLGSCWGASKIGYHKLGSGPLTHAPTERPRIIIEAEDMHAQGFHTVQGGNASGGKLAKLGYKTGDLFTGFDGPAGTYDLSVFVQDEIDGQSKLNVIVNAEVVGIIVLDRDSDGGGSNNGQFSEFVIAGIELQPGDTVKIATEGNCSEFVRIDKLKLRQVADNPPLPGAVSGTYFVDENQNGIDDAGDSDVADKAVLLIDGNGNEVGSTRTDSSGDYRFNDVPVGDYQVRFEPSMQPFVDPDLGDDSVDSDVVDAATGTTALFAVVAKKETRNIDAGVGDLIDPTNASISGRYFRDENRDGLDNGGANNGLQNIRVKLLDSDGKVIASDRTGANGDYSFTGLTAGTYGVRFIDAQSGQALVTPHVGDDDSIDSDATFASDTTSVILGISLNTGEQSIDNDAGVQSKGCDNPDAIKLTFDNLERGDVLTTLNPHVTIGAYKFTHDGRWRDADAMIFDTENPSGGDDDLAYNGQGKVLIVSEDGDRSDPDDNAFGGALVFDFATPMDVFDLTVIDTEEGGYVALYDADGQLIKRVVLPHLADGEVAQVLLDADGVSRMEVKLGGSGAIDDICYVKPVFPASLGGSYFTDVNNNDLQDGDDTAVAKTTVALLQNGVVIATQTTDASGNYLFETLSPGDGYAVRFIDTGEGKVFVSADAGTDDTIDSDVVAVDANGSGTTDLISLIPGEDRRNVDAGIEDVINDPHTASLGDTVFFDGNGNGVFDAGDGVVSDVTVELLDDAGAVLRTTTTDGQGNYLFDGLEAGDYIVQFTQVDGFEFTAANVGDDTTDSDADQATGRSAEITLAIGEQNKTVDAGLIQSNAPPIAMDDEACVCATESKLFDVLENDNDPDIGDTLLIAQIDGQAVNAGDQFTLASGAVVTVNGNGTLSYDSANFVSPDGMAAADLPVGTNVNDLFSYRLADGQGGFDDAQVTVEVKGALNTYQALLDSLPDTAIAIQGAQTIALSYSSRLSATGDERFDGIRFEDTYCIERTETFKSKIEVTMDVRPGDAGVLDPALFSNDVMENLNKINWLLNQNFSSQSNGDTNGPGAGQNYTQTEIQHAIWGLSDGDSQFRQPETVGTVFNGTQENADELLAMALAHGSGFVPGKGDLVTLILDPTDVQADAPLANRPEDNDYDQAFIMALPYDAIVLECDCDDGLVVM